MSSEFLSFSEDFLNDCQNDIKIEGNGLKKKKRKDDAATRELKPKGGIDLTPKDFNGHRTLELWEFINEYLYIHIYCLPKVKPCK